MRKKERRQGQRRGEKRKEGKSRGDTMEVEEREEQTGGSREERWRS